MPCFIPLSFMDIEFIYESGSILPYKGLILVLEQRCVVGRVVHHGTSVIGSNSPFTNGRFLYLT